ENRLQFHHGSSSLTRFPLESRAPGRFSRSFQSFQLSPCAARSRCYVSHSSLADPAQLSNSSQPSTGSALPLVTSVRHPFCPTSQKGNLRQIPSCCSRNSSIDLG